MSATVFVVTAVLLGGVQAGYLKLARHFGIIDTPNERSSHTGLTTIRGGGILFFVAGLGAFLYSHFAYPYFFVGLTGVAAVSFLDDLRPLPSRYRLAAQFAGIGLLLYQTGMLTHEIGVIAGLLVVGVGILNAWNFMDGINGMTAWYSLVCVGTLWFWQHQQHLPVSVLLPYSFLALLIFSHVNARRQAICFAGDVGSVAIAFIILLPLLQLIISTKTWLPILLLAVYGIDSTLTILHRVYLRQPIFQAHRLHLFQILVHRLNWPHLRAAALYASVQLLINVLIMQAMAWNYLMQWTVACGILTALSVAYILLKRERG
jgi:UDP-GlcNAc:undecaprenyl-phosphate/decaprenyl-phosphate GlcNAc-1-phosphate transferase